MENRKRQLILRPSVINPHLWYPPRPPEAEWKKIRKLVMETHDWTCIFCGHRALKYMNTHHLEDSGDNSPENLAPVCVACHAVLHIGLNLENGIIEIWKSEMSQVDIVRYTRNGIKQGLSLPEINSKFKLVPGPYSPNSIDYANMLVHKMGKAPRAYLDEPLCAVFVNLSRWQIEE